MQARARPREAHMLRAITIFMISFDPPKMRLIRLSRNMRAMGLVHFRTEGKLAYYRASDPVMVSLLQQGVEHARDRRSESHGGGGT